jgi:hypothetical protein
VLLCLTFTIRYQLSLEVASAKSGSSLVNDNVEQRRKSLTAKLAAHEQARSFYMPGFASPVGDAAFAAEKTPLHLPSSLSTKARARYCRDGVVDAERSLRDDAMGDALADLLRHLRTRTFILRHKAKQATGVRTGTRLRDSVAGVSRRVDAAAAGYQRHRRAYKALQGPGPWEKTYRPLSALDVQGLSEQAVSEQEMVDRYRAKALAEALASVFRSADPADLPTLAAGVKAATAVHDAQTDIPDDGEDEDKGDAENIEEIAPLAQAARLLAEKAVTGEGHRKISWIWVSSLQLEDVNDPQLTDGAFTCLCLNVTDHQHAGLRMEWARARARRDRWMEEAVLNTEEMRRNIVYCRYERQQWLGLADSPADPRWSGGSVTVEDKAAQAELLLLDPALHKGRRSYALERARDEEQLAAGLVAMWRPVYTRWLKSDLLGPHLVDPGFDTAPTFENRHGDTTADTAIPQSKHNAALLELPVLLQTQMSLGLPMTTNDCDYDVT